MLVPMVISQDGRAERSFDIYSRLLNERVDVPRLGGRRRGREPRGGPAAAPRGRGPREGHLPVRQLAGRTRSTPAWRSTTRCSYIRPDVAHDLLRDRDVDGRADPDRRHAGQAVSLPNGRMLIHQPRAASRARRRDIDIHARETIALRGQLDGCTRSTPARTVGARSTTTWSATATSRRRRASGTGSSTGCRPSAENRFRDQAVAPFRKRF